MEFIVQYAKSDLTHCTKCEGKISLEEIRIAYKKKNVSIKINFTFVG